MAAVEELQLHGSVIYSFEIPMGVGQRRSIVPQKLAIDRVARGVVLAGWSRCPQEEEMP